MRYHEFGKTGEKISVLNLGCMRFPDEEITVEIVAKAVELGINYFETSIGYVGGNSERWLGKGLGQDRKFVSFFCDGCRYCLSVCPENIGPHNIFKAYNMVMLKSEPTNPQEVAQRAQSLLDRCILCGECQEICPQDIDVPEHLERVRDYLLAMEDA